MKRCGLALGLTTMLALAALAQSCASVLGVDATDDAVAAMCQCNERLTFLGSRAQCQELIAQRVDGASEETRQAWLERFADAECEQCANVLECYYQKPACNVGECSDSVECCGNDDGTGYCLQGLCRRKDPECKHTFEACASADECCGAEGGLAECSFGVCVENCSFGDSENCKDCCMRALFDGPQGPVRRDVCLDPADGACPLLCNPDVEQPCVAATATCKIANDCDVTTKDDVLCPYLCLP